MTHSDYTALVNTVKAHDYHYFVENSPIISDEEYDRLFFQLQDYEQQNPTMVLPDSPTQYAHGEVKNGHKQVRRRTPMLSTQKAQTVEAVEKWMKTTAKAAAKFTKYGSVGFTVEWKYDGVSVSLVYQDGKLIEASYGKGSEGNDCLATCLRVPSIPHILDAIGRAEVRGELVVPFADLPKTGYKNCRSAAAGILADTETNFAECLEFHPYWSDITEESITRHGCSPCTDLYGKLSFLRNIEKMVWTPMQIGERWEYNIMDVKGVEGMKEAITELTKMRSTLKIPVDGLVFKVRQLEAWESLGATAHHSKYSIAYKFAAETAETTVTRIEITTGATGKRTPVAYFEPVVINGATYQKASVGSEAKLAELGIEVGSKVVVALRNDVIPHIERSLTKPSQEGRMFNTPEHCEDDFNNPFIGNDESGENFENPNPEIEIETEQGHKGHKGHSFRQFMKKAGKVAGTMCVGALAIAGAATLLYCCVGLIFFLPLVLAKR